MVNFFEHARHLILSVLLAAAYSCSLQILPGAFPTALSTCVDSHVVYRKFMTPCGDKSVQSLQGKRRHTGLLQWQFRKGTSVLQLRGGKGKKRTEKGPVEESRAVKKGALGDSAVPKKDEVTSNCGDSDGDSDNEDEESTGESDSIDEFAYSASMDGGDRGVDTHTLGTAPTDKVVPPAKASAQGGDDDGSSESYPGCYGSDSDDVEEELVEDEHSGPLPSREELIRKIRDRPFNQSLVGIANLRVFTPFARPGTRQHPLHAGRSVACAHTPVRQDRDEIIK
jgi:hypothetical protein